MDSTLLILSGPPASGKRTIWEAVRPVFPQVVRAVSTTTRAPRPEDVDGETYHFSSKERFLELDRKGEILEKDLNKNGHFYGTSRSALADAMARGHVLHEVEVNGAKNIKAQFNQAVTIFILPPNYLELESRLRQRATESEDEILIRLATARVEVGQTHFFDYVIENDTLDIASQKLARLLSYLLDGERPDPSEFCPPERIRQILATFI